MPITVGVFREAVRSKSINISGNIATFINRNIPSNTSNSVSKEKRSSTNTSSNASSQASTDPENGDEDQQRNIFKKFTLSKLNNDRQATEFIRETFTTAYVEPPSPPAPPPGGLFESATNSVQAKMRDMLQLTHQVASPQDDLLQCSVFATKVSRALDHYVVIIGDSDGSPAGMWSAKLCTRSGREGGGVFKGSLGSMLPYLSKAKKEKYGVIVYDNIFQGYVSASGTINMKQVISRFINGWRQFVATSTATHVFVVAYRNGGNVLVESMRKYHKEMYRHISGIAFIEPTHQITSSDPYVLRKLVAQWSVAYISSEKPLLTRLNELEEQIGSVCLSTGRNESCVDALQAVMESTFASFKARWSGFRIKTANNGMERGCYLCLQPFNMRRWRRHCRTCQNACCDRCSSMETVQAEGFVRLCSTCRSLPSLVQWSRPRAVRTGEKESVYSDCANPGKMSVLDFELINIIGSGACGKVLLVQKKAGNDAGKLYAMKVLKKNWVLDKDLVTQTMAERRILQEANHPYIVQLQYAFQNRDKLYMAMDYYSGGSLRQALRRKRRFSIRRAQIYLAQIFLAISHLHSLDIVYRDLKLENVVIDADGNVACTDFGLSKEEMDDKGRTKSFVGTCEYLAPELIIKEGYGKAVDWWAFGILAYEMIQGDSPFRHSVPSMLFEKILKEEPRFTERFPSDAIDLIKNLLKKDPSRRLGCKSKGLEEIKEHPFFEGVDWQGLLEKRVSIPRPPHRMEDVTDESHLARAIAQVRDSREEIMPDSPMSLTSSPKKQMHFERFSYMGSGDWHPSMADMPYEEIDNYGSCDIENEGITEEDEADSDELPSTPTKSRRT